MQDAVDAIIPPSGAAGRELKGRQATPLRGDGWHPRPSSVRRAREATVERASRGKADRQEGIDPTAILFCKTGRGPGIPCYRLGSPFRGPGSRPWARVEALEATLQKFPLDHFDRFGYRLPLNTGDGVSRIPLWVVDYFAQSETITARLKKFCSVRFPIIVNHVTGG